MSEADDLRAFATSLLRDVGAEVRDDGTFLWATVPEAAQAGLDLPAQACLTLDPERVGEFDAELVASGSYLLEKLLALATRRGRWEVARLAADSEGWVLEAARRAFGPSADVEVLSSSEEPLALFAIRTTLTSDEKREAFHLIAATLDGQDSWEVGWPLVEEGLTATPLPGYAPDLGPAYARVQEALQARMGEELAAFQKTSLAALEEEVRRIFRYFDGTVAEVREAEPSHADDVVRAIEAERGRRLAEALERFEPHAVASLCSVRVVRVPTARLRVRTSCGRGTEALVDALTQHARGLHGAVTAAGRVRPRGRPR